MSNYKKQIASAVAAGAMLLNLAAPVVAGTTLEISGNAYNSDNTVNVTVGGTTTVTQTNVADIDNDIHASSTTGGNSANQNNGGAVLIGTGNADVDVAVTNMANSNSADVDGCCDVDTEAVIEGNAGKTDNDINVTNGNAVTLWQDNLAEVDNKVHAKATSGGNSANQNNGGNVGIATGNASVAEEGVVINNTLNANHATVGANGDGAGLFSARIAGNGYASVNTINATLAKALVMNQFNNADVDNHVSAFAGTGKNNANQNSGGDTLISTGNADVDVLVDTAANFNWADTDCGCTMGASAKIAGNAGNTDNDINATLGSVLSVYQDNLYACEKQDSLSYLFDMIMGGGGGNGKDCNSVHAFAGTGMNAANQNNGDVGSDPGVLTGDADSNVEVVNTGNSNAFGSTAPDGWWDDVLPVGFEWPEGWEMQSKLGFLFGMFGMWS